MIPTKKIVFITDYWFPNLSAGSLCVRNIVQYLNKTGLYEIIVIASSGDKRIEETIYQEDIRIINIKTKKKIRRFNLEKKLQQTNSNIIYKGLMVLHKMSNLFSAIFLNKNSIDKAMSSSYHVALQELGEIDILIPCCFPFESIVAAVNYKKENPKTRLNLMLYDLFSVSETLHWFKFNKIWKFKQNLVLEIDAFNIADRVFYIWNWKTHIKMHLATFVYKCTQVGVPLMVDHTLISENNNLAYELLFSGSINAVDRCPEYTVNLLNEVLKIEKKMKVVFHVRGNNTEVISKLQENYKENVFFEVDVSNQLADIEKEKCDCFISIGNKNHIQVPSKIFDCMSYGKPIIHLYHDEKDPVIEILLNYEYGLCIKQSSELLNSNVEKVVSFIQLIGKKKLTYSEIIKSYSEYTPEYIAKLILS